MLDQIKLNDGSISEIDQIPSNIRKRFKEVFEINCKSLIKIAAHRGKWIDQSQSLNLFYRGNSGREITELYMYTWELGIKTTYYLRTLAKPQVEKATVSGQTKQV